MNRAGFGKYQNPNLPGPDSHQRPFVLIVEREAVPLGTYGTRIGANQFPTVWSFAIAGPPWAPYIVETLLLQWWIRPVQHAIENGSAVLATIKTDFGLRPADAGRPSAGYGQLGYVLFSAASPNSSLECRPKRDKWHTVFVSPGHCLKLPLFEKDADFRDVDRYQFRLRRMVWARQYAPGDGARH